MNNFIPVSREILADLDTPVSAYLKLAYGKYSYLFESVVGGEKWGRYSIIGLPAKTVIRVTGYLIEIERDNVITERIEVANPLAWIADFQKRFHVPKSPNLPRFTGGLVGYFGYETIAYIESRLDKKNQFDQLQTPDIVLMVCDELLVFDNLKSKIYVIVHAESKEADSMAKAEQRLDELVACLRENKLPTIEYTPTGKVKEADFVTGFGKNAYEEAVQKIKEYILAGDVMQVVLSQRLSIPCDIPPLNVYRALRILNPSPYMYYVDLGDFHIVGSSPEILVRLEGDMITVRPIAGTRPRGKNESEDLVLERELLADPKERAEHVMLIDLGRNDVGRVAQIGSVQLTESMVIERYSHVMHIVSNVIGKIKPEFNALNVLRATFPAGTVSGAPKIRAMEIINELEPVKRSIYGGAIGYLSWHGDIDTAIAIRTAVIKDKILHIQVGAGIVADSIPAKEWEETMNKGRAIFKAVALAARGLN